MKSFTQWIATMLAVGVFLTLSFCGMAIAPTMVHAGTMIDTMSCVSDGCSASSAPCLTQCIQRLNRAQQSLVAEVVAIVAAGAFLALLFDRFCSNVSTAYFCAPPWRSHRLFALRE